MKKILFFLSTIFLLSACSNDNDTISNNDNEIKYPVTLNIKSPKIEIETSTLRTTTTPIADGDPAFYDLVIYKENGEVYSQWFYDVQSNSSNETPNINNENLNIFTTEGKTISTQLYLPAGNYHVAMLIYKQDSKHPISYMSSIDANNYNTDNTDPFIVDGEIYFSKVHNGGAYFNVTDLTVVASQTNQNMSMELQPMWSYIDVNIKDAQTFDVPEGTNALQFVIDPLYYGINVKTKSAPFEDNRPIVISLDSVRTNPTFNLRTTVSKSVLSDNAINTKIIFLKINGDTTILDTKQLPIPNSILENGYYYNIHGALGSKNSGQSMNISLGEFNKEDVNIEF